MRLDEAIRSILLESGYATRVSDAASYIASTNPSDLDEVNRTIRLYYSDTTEYKLSKANPKSKAWPDFVKDVIIALKKIYKFPKAEIKRPKAEIKQPFDLDWVGNLISSEVGNSFPDGDPFDAISIKFRKKYNSQPSIELLDKACKKATGKTYFKYLKSVWDDFGDPKNNPWK